MEALNAEDTIVAQATPSGRGGVAVVRVSGSDVKAIINSVVRKDLNPRVAQLTPFYHPDYAKVDVGLSVFFPGPNSFTGEDVVEFHCHGGQVVVNLLIEACLHYGARRANPGEFSLRAYLNNKIDLVQAEAIADLIDASTVNAAQAALQSLQGKFSENINELAEKILHLRLYVEAAIDFPEEEIDFLQDKKILEQHNELITAVEATIAAAREGLCLNQGVKLLILGPPNAGKSSLLNLLAQNDCAIVTEIPGTTRDIVKANLLINDINFEVLDTAGIRETEDRVEQAGIKRAINSINLADVVLLIIDAATSDLSAFDKLIAEVQQQEPHKKIILLANKIDLLKNAPEQSEYKTLPLIYSSIKETIAIDKIKKQLLDAAGITTATESSFSARARHVDALKRSLDELKNSQACLQHSAAGELMAEHLKIAHDALGEICGQVSADDLLGEIFSSFCIGK